MLSQCLPVELPGDHKERILDHMQPRRRRIDRHPGKAMALGQQLQHAGDDRQLVVVADGEFYGGTARRDEIAEILALNQLEQLMRGDCHSTISDEPDADIGPLCTPLVISHDAPHPAPAQGGGGKLEAAPIAGSEVGLPVEQQKIAREFLDRVVGTRQQRQYFMDVGQSDHGPDAGSLPIGADQPPPSAIQELEKLGFAKAQRALLRVRE